MIALIISPNDFPNGDAGALRDLSFAKIYKQLGYEVFCICKNKKEFEGEYQDIKYKSLYVAKKGFKKLSKILDACHLLVLNKEEAKEVAKSKSNNVDVLLKKLQSIVPLVVITDGKKGAFAYNGIEKYTLRVGRQKIVETTGAGDSFASGFLSGIILGLNIEDCLRMGYAEASSVIKYIGAKEKLLNKTQALKAVKSKNLCKISKKRI